MRQEVVGCEGSHAGFLGEELPAVVADDQVDLVLAEQELFDRAERVGSPGSSGDPDHEPSDFGAGHFRNVSLA